MREVGGGRYRRERPSVRPHRCSAVGTLSVACKGKYGRAPRGSTRPQPCRRTRSQIHIHKLILKRSGGIAPARVYVLQLLFRHVRHHQLGQPQFFSRPIPCREPPPPLMSYIHVNSLNILLDCRALLPFPHAVLALGLTRHPAAQRLFGWLVCCGVCSCLWETPYLSPVELRAVAVMLGDSRCYANVVVTYIGGCVRP